VPAGHGMQQVRLAHANGFLWSIGNGLVSTSLVTYLARELGAQGIGISLIVAAPHLAGVLRLVAPPLIARFDRKRFCLASFIGSVSLLLLLPVLAAPGTLPTRGLSLAALIGLWALYHLGQYLATVALWSWLGEITPPRIRGRFLGYRERAMLAGTIPAMLASGLFSYYWNQNHPKSAHWLGYAMPAAIGALFMLAALEPLRRLAAYPQRRRTGAPSFQTQRFLLAELWAPLQSRSFLGFLAFGIWFSVANGLTQSAQFFYPANVLGLGLFSMLALQSGMRLGQIPASPWLGRLCDRWGNRPVLAGCQLLTAAGLLFYAAATPASPWWIAGAWVLWIAFAGLNVGLPNLMLGLSPRGSSTSTIALYFAATSLAFGLSSILGGWIYDVWGKSPGYFTAAFVGGWLVRSLGVGWLWFVREPMRATLR